MMKKIIAVLCSFVFVFGLAACGNSGSKTGQESAVEHADYAQAENGNTDVTENTEAAEDADIPETQAEDTESPADGQEEETPETQQGKVLVAYFSATNTTEGVAINIAEGLNADLYEIVPQEPYTDADLDYNDNSSRSTVEMNDPDSRPAISSSVEDMGQYDIVFIGYPIWWGEAPRIVSTFVESYDFYGKTIVPFCTSGGSGMGSSATNLEQLTSGANWLDGARLNGGDSQDAVMEWVNGLGLSK